MVHGLETIKRLNIQADSQRRAENSVSEFLELSWDNPKVGRQVIHYIPRGEDTRPKADEFLEDKEKRYPEIAGCDTYLNGVEASLFGSEPVVATVLAIPTKYKCGVSHETQNIACSAKGGSDEAVANCRRLVVEGRNRMLRQFISENPGRQVVYWVNWFTDCNYGNLTSGNFAAFISEMGCPAVWDDRDLLKISGQVTRLDVGGGTHFQDLGANFDAMLRQPGSGHVSFDDVVGVKK